ncbi:conserved hypothetical protein [Histoplasma capsulatum var. duboisii H88]|uniref:Protein BNI4 n=1 Tax=Ajellomyces capsulatus (strain H88) TaxID=544711 RepID=F0UFG2_AJEC8|nr:conserved hypothetical protein [Histoplasma capsulatum var. duboisii H88]QSS54907.1 hypothetical protein I7I53_02613 [Histoplasma capsulatum var. duboisii H88]
MAALVQTIPQQTNSITLLQPRASSTGTFPSPTTSTLQQHSQMSRNQQPSRASHNNVLENGNGNGIGYRTSQAGHPVAPYAFTSTPSLTNTGSSHMRQNGPHHLKTEDRAVSAPSTVHTQANPTYPGLIPSRVHFPAAGSVSNTFPTIPSSVISQVSKDDSAIPTRQRTSEPPARPLSSIGLTSPAASAKPSPDRYRRGQRRAETQNGLMQTSSPVANGPLQSSFGPSIKQGAPPSHFRGVSADDGSVNKPQSSEQAKRYRRRSLGSLDMTPVNVSEQKSVSETQISLDTKDLTPQNVDQQPHSAQSYSHSHKGSAESVSSTRSSPPTGKRAPPVSSPTTLKLDHKLIENPKRVTNPSPLSQPVDMSSESSETKHPTTTNSATKTPSATQEQSSSPSQGKTQSPAAKRLTELSKKGFHKSGKSRLRRALSFGSVAELRAASAQETTQTGRPSQEVSRKQQLDEELGVEQAAIAEEQEANGLGESIYSGQGHLFSGSMDNLSISSTASSASIMLRKMGKGVRNSTRSLVGLFRPKSTPNTMGNATAPAEPMTPRVSIVNVEAERDNNVARSKNSTSVQVNDNNSYNYNNEPATSPSAQGRTSVETGSSDTGGEQSYGADNVNAVRKSIMGGERERAEVLAAVRKGILKRSGTGSNTSSPTLRPVEFKGVDMIPVPHIQDSPHSSAPSTPNGDRDHPPRSGHRRTDSITIEGEDYFLPSGRFTTSDSSSAPVTPQTAARNISFSPRIQFHDTWPSGEYDRRGDIATCNRLTPLLAQQIKEELNTFKMEMEVHESSKVYTHFF